MNEKGQIRQNCILDRESRPLLYFSFTSTDSLNRSTTSTQIRDLCFISSCLCLLPPASCLLPPASCLLPCILRGPARQTVASCCSAGLQFPRACERKQSTVCLPKDGLPLGWTVCPPGGPPPPEGQTRCAPLILRITSRRRRDLARRQHCSEGPARSKQVSRCKLLVQASAKLQTLLP